ALMACSAQAQSVIKRNLTTSAFKSVAYLSQEVALNGVVSTEARVAPLTVSSAGFGLDKMANNLWTFPVMPPPALSLPHGITPATASSATHHWLSTHIAPFKARVGQWLTQQNLSMA